VNQFGHQGRQPIGLILARGPSTPSFDHLVGAGEHGCRNLEAQRLRGLEVDDQLVLGWCLHGQVGGLLALEDAVNVRGRAAVLVDQIRPIRDQSTDGDERALVVNRGQLVPGRKPDNQIAMSCRQCADDLNMLRARARARVMGSKWMERK
jgi:hypothetical protein